MPRTKIFTQSDIDKALVKAKLKGKPVRVHVFDVARLYLRASPDGSVRYIHRYTVPEAHRGAKKQPIAEITAGAPGTPLDRAKATGQKYNELLRDGIDPREAKKWKVRDEKTLGQLAEEYIEANQSSNGASWLKDTRNLIFNHSKLLLSLPILHVTETRIKDVLRLIPTAQGERTRTKLEQVIQYGQAQRLYPRGVENPASWDIQRHLVPGLRKNSKGHRLALPLQQVRDFMQKLRQQKSISGWALEFAILTLCRTQEVLGARWDEIEGGVWTVPAERMKIKTEQHRVPLSVPALELLEQCRTPAKAGVCDYVFTSTGEPLNKKSLRSVLYDMGFKGQATVHGFRASFRTWARMMKFGYEASELCLAHSVGSKSARAYIRDELDDLMEERRIIMQAWADFCEGRQADHKAQAVAGLPGRGAAV